MDPDPLSIVEAGATRVVVCIPTFRRPAQLAALLGALARQRGVPPFSIVIGDNDAGAVASYPELADPSLPTFSVLAVHTRGVSAVRNAMLAEVLADPRGVRWVACIDDDQMPQPDWLANLLTAGETHDADLVGGPVLRTAPSATFWSQAAADTSYLPQVTGPTSMLNEAGNLLVATRFLRTLDRPPFSLAYGRTGGEDYEFFLHACSRGARLVWANDARVQEPLRDDRVTLGGFASRFYTIAAYQARADVTYRGMAFVLGQVVRDVGRCATAVAVSLVRDRRPSQALQQLIRFAMSIAGRIAGAVGLRRDKYGTTN